MIGSHAQIVGVSRESRQADQERIHTFPARDVMGLAKYSMGLRSGKTPNTDRLKAADYENHN